MEMTSINLRSHWSFYIYIVLTRRKILFPIGQIDIFITDKLPEKIVYQRKQRIFYTEISSKTYEFSNFE